MILGLGSILAGIGEEKPAPEGEATAAMCTTQLLGGYESASVLCDDDFVIEQDMVYTFDSLNLEMDMEEL